MVHSSFFAWDTWSTSRLLILPNGELDPDVGFETGQFETTESLKRALDVFEERAGALQAHATWVRYRVCLISMQMSWTAVMEQARKIHDRRVRRGLVGYIYVTAIDARKLAQGRWKLLRMADELEVHNLELDHYISGGQPWYHRWYRDEVLAIDRIPADCILRTFRLESKMDWQSGAEVWRDKTFVPTLEEALGFSNLPRGLVPALFQE
ncbi:MAG: hypothetical protein Q9213_007060 [Squamulea squamosa]